VRRSVLSGRTTQGHVVSESLVADRLQLGVSAIGMVSPLGADAVTSCAAARAGISRAAPLEGLRLYDEDAWQDVGVTGHAMHRFVRGFEGFGRLLRLARGGLDDLLLQAPLTPAQGARTALCVAVGSAYFQVERARAPEARAEDTEKDRAQLLMVREQLLPRLVAHTSLPMAALHQHLFMDDQCGFVQALFRAQALLASGSVDRCIVGGVDACTDGAFMAAAHRFQALKTATQPAGFQPGEAAAFLMIETDAAAKARGARWHARIEAASWTRDPITRVSGKPAVGQGLAQALRAGLAHAAWPAEQTSWLLGDLNGDVFRANDWGYALVRLKPEHPQLGEQALTLPAEHFGELGAATGPVAACMAMRAFERRYAPGRRALVWLSAYGGSRATFTLQPHDAQGS